MAMKIFESSFLSERRCSFKTTFFIATASFAIGINFRNLLSSLRFKRSTWKWPKINLFYERNISVEISKTLNIHAGRTRHYLYFEKEALLVVAPPKSGSTAFYSWLFTGITGKIFNCETSYVQNPSALCWEGRVRSINELDPRKKHYALTSADVMRIAVWREPFSRLISCWKNKYSCHDVQKKNESILSVRPLLPRLYKTAGISSNRKCISIDTFADLLHIIRRKYKRGEIGLEGIDPHIRPQEYFPSYIRYDLVLNVKDLSSPRKMDPIWRRLKFRDKIPKSAPVRNKTSNRTIFISAEVGAHLSEFSSLTNSSFPGM